MFDSGLAGVEMGVFVANSTLLFVCILFRDGISVDEFGEGAWTVINDGIDDLVFAVDDLFISEVVNHHRKVPLGLAKMLVFFAGGLAMKHLYFYFINYQYD